jgi:hypothetical protein
VTFRVVLSIFAATLSTVAVGQENASSLVANARSLELEYWKWTPNNTVSYWDVSFSGEEIRTLDKLLARATAYEQEGLVLYITAFRGEFRTERQTFRISIGEQKLAGRPVLFLLREANAPKSRLMYRLLGEDARTFMTYFDEALESRTQNVKPDRVVQH